ncbi:MAG: hypothetical protein ACE366_17305 [Bradymonadia bacterium]
MRILSLLLLVALGFGGGFFTGIEFRNHELAEKFKDDPKGFAEDFYKEFGREFKSVAKKKLDKIVDVLME